MARSLAVIALARLRAERDYNRTKLEHGREKEGWMKTTCVTEDRWRTAEDISLLFLQEGKGQREKNP